MLAIYQFFIITAKQKKNGKVGDKAWQPIYNIWALHSQLEATQHVQELFALFTVAHSYAGHIYWECPAVHHPRLNTVVTLGEWQTLGTIRKSQ